VGPLTKDELQIFSIGGYSATSKDKRKFAFDWYEMSAGTENDENGHLVINCELKDFEIEDYKEMNLENNVEQSELTPEFIVSSSLEELYYEAFNDEINGDLIPFDLVEFSILVWDNDKNDYTVFDFSEEQIKDFNENYSHYKEVN
jgi:hypothetical protein